MKKICLAIVSLVLFSAGLPAQDFPKVEIFGGYQFLKASQDDYGKMLHGWRMSVAGNFNRYFGIEGALSGTYGDLYDIDGEPDDEDIDVGARIHSYSYLFGPRFTARSKVVTGFAHFLVGGSRNSISAAATDPSASLSSNGFAWAVGGGLDLNLGEHLAIRPAQIDYGKIHTGDDFSGTLNSLGYSAGIVLKF
ncbi:MAG: outer membrane beta-barrel protein [Acidobacteria bacterium]|nr:outer membrane beta-barrel protein [Acidobacteriota bacterium]